MPTTRQLTSLKGAAKFLNGSYEAMHVYEANNENPAHSRFWPSCTDRTCALRRGIVKDLEELARDLGA